ncbi:hypothetical protein C8R44DRAFT_892895 [Mycena epipterygia]|nr:hypothetical protein C8R44DRAFT_892895 [Mycena epipterygia]
MESLSPVPAFPLELEQQIFEIAALLQPVGIPKLMLVAWRVKEWVEPLLYRIIALDQPRRLPVLPAITTTLLSSAMESRPAFFHRVIRHIMISDVHTSIPEYVLSICSGVDNLWVNDDLTQTISVMEPLRLQHLYAQTLPFLRILSPLHPFFSRITHLELMDAPDAQDLEAWRLGQSCISSRSSPISHSMTMPSLLFVASYPSSVAELSHDFRFVVMCCDYYQLDWQMGAHAGIDYWSRAEIFIGKRRSGEIDALQYEILVDESENLY